MIKHGMPLTRQNYIDINWWGELPETIDEDEQQVLDLLGA